MSIKLNTLIPELSITNFKKSLAFYTNILGFSIVYQRAEEGFAFLALGEAQIMIDAINLSRTWKTAELTYPLGRGINLQINVTSIESILVRLKHHNIALFMDVEEKWYRQKTCEVGNKQFLIQDLDGYLLRFVEDLGSRPYAK